MSACLLHLSSICLSVYRVQLYEFIFCRASMLCFYWPCQHFHWPLFYTLVYSTGQILENITIFNAFERSLLLASSLHLFDRNTEKVIL